MKTRLALTGVLTTGTRLIITMKIKRGTSIRLKLNALSIKGQTVLTTNYSRTRREPQVLSRNSSSQLGKPRSISE